MKKKTGIALILALLIMTFVSFSAFADAFIAKPILIMAPAVTVKVDGNIVQFERAPIIESGRTLVPYSGISNVLKAKASWDKDENKILIDSDYTTIELSLGSSKAYIHHKYDFSGIPEKVSLDVGPKLLGGLPYIPLRFAAERLGAAVDWDGKTSTVIIKTPAAAAQYKVLTAEDIECNEKVFAWYEENYKNHGIHYKTFAESTYVIISAGEKPTSGYSIEVDSVQTVAPGHVYITAIVKKPAPDAILADVITYPHFILELDKALDKVEGQILVYSSDMSEMDLPFEIVKDEEISANGELAEWVEENRKVEGIHYKRIENDLYVLVCAGEKSTGGYSVQIINVVLKKPDEAYVYAVLHSPSKDDIVTQVITYPCSLIKIADANIKHVLGKIE